MVHAYVTHVKMKNMMMVWTAAYATLARFRAAGAAAHPTGRRSR